MGIFGDLINNAENQIKSSAESEVSNAIRGGIAKATTKDTSLKCPKCRKPVTEDLKFCPACGAKLKLECQKCHLFFPIGTKFCSECGSTLK